ncbi:MAG TPA: TlyA family RNA methyltransferase [Nannocystaceae bacterium]|nr:TlyA family RNA methyltransferase [Nannocystaceae bacterium]
MTTAGRTARERLDKLLVERELCESRARAQALILAGKVIVGEHTVTKAGTMVAADAAIRLRGEDHGFVSRGGLKLQGALREFSGLDVRGRVAMDVGASTGGFTDCLLQAGVARVHAVDVGYGQLAWKLATDPRVVVHERTNIRTLTPSTVGEAIDLVVIDCSFISLGKVLPALPALLAPRADLVALVKPQFEVGPERVGKGGIVRDAEAQEDALRGAVAAAEALGMGLRGRCESPILGREGNREFLIWLAWPLATPGSVDTGG